jgi:sugar phosphate isomerase/epimerase
MLESFRLDYPAAIKKAKELGAQGIQVYTTTGDLAPENMSGAKRREFLAMVQDSGLVISALCGDLGHGFGDKERNASLVERSCRILDLAKDLETSVVTTHIGVVPADKNHDRYKVMAESCRDLADYADKLGAHFAVETGPERAETLKGFLDSLGSTGVAVNMDPANLVMVTGDDPAQAVYTLRDYIVHTHAKDGRKLRDKPPEAIYGLSNDAEGEMGDAFIELPLGQGDVPWDRYLAALVDIGYHGFLTIEREVGAEPERDIRTAIEFLRKRI